MEKKKTSVFENSLIWFGAGVSIAEIITGTLFAPLGFKKGIAAVIIGHIIGCVLLFMAGVIGGKSERSAMETVKMSFGSKGSLLFSILNILQLAGWTSIMIFDGAAASSGVFDTPAWIWCIVIGVLVIVWILIGVKNLGKLNTVAMVLLFGLTLVLSWQIFFKGSVHSISSEGMSFGAAVELSVAMPLSWLPLISDYTREAKKPVAASAASAAVYGLVSCWMYIIGMGAAIFTEETDIAKVMLKAGLGAAALLIVILSTVTTTFLDAYSAGVSSESVFAKIKGKWVAVGAAVIGTLAAIFFEIYDITDFLYLIGSVFAPMIAVQIADFFILKKDVSGKSFDVRGLAVWALGFIIYRLLMKVDIVTGYTLPAMLITTVLDIAVTKITVFTKKA